MDTVRIGIIGVGNMGTAHAKRLAAGEIEGAKLGAICDINPDRLKWARETFGEELPLFDDSEKLLASGCVDAIVIATPHYFHPTIGIRGFETGHHVLSEKPIGVYTNGAKELIAAAKNTPDKVFAIMFNQRTNPMYQKIKQMIDEGAIGELKRCVWIITNWYRTQSYYNSGGWRATWAGEGGGVLINQCPHQLDLWQWMCGMPVSVRAFCEFGKHHDIEVEDDVTAYVKYPNGATGVFITTTGETPGANRLEISGTKGKILIDGRNQIKYWKLKTDEREWCYNCPEGFAVPECEITEINPEGEESSHRGILQNFTNAILKGEKLIAPAEEGINGLSLSNAMLLSSWLDREITLPIDGDLFYEELQKRIATSNYVKPEVKSVVFNTEGTYGR